MTLLFADFPSGSIGRYGGDNNLMRQSFPGAGGLYLDPRPGADGQGYVWGLSSGANFYMNLGLPDLAYRCVYAFRIYQGELPDTNGRSTIFRIWEDEDEVSQDIQLSPDGRLGDGFLVTGAWQLVEIMWGAGDDYEGLIIRIDGEVVLDAPNGGEIYRPELPKMPAYFFRIINSGAPSWCALKDFTFQYGTDAEFLGPCNVRELKPIADVSSGWTLTGSADEFQALDNAPPLPGNYISAPAPIPAPSVTELGGLRPNTKAIHGLYPSIVANTDNPSSVQVSLVESATPRAGGVHALDSTRRFYQDEFLTDPATGLPWDPAVVADLNLSINRTV